MLWEQEVVSDCLNNFSVFSQTFLRVFSQTCTSYRNTALSSCSSLPFLEYFSYPIYRISSHFGAHSWSTLICVASISKAKHMAINGKIK